MPNDNPVSATPYILDIEASGLGDESYPIEIAWCSIDGNDCYSTLINPESAGGWDYWDDFAESAVHGISRKQCCERGENVVIVARRLSDLLLNAPVFSDAPYQDQLWIKALFDASGAVCPSALMPIEQLVAVEDRPGLTRSLSELERPHRALNDCIALRELIVTVREQ